MPNRSEENDAGLGEIGRERIEEAAVLGQEAWQPVRTVERIGHAVTDEHDGRRGVAQLTAEEIPAFVWILTSGLAQAQAGARCAGGRVGAPAKTAEADIGCREAAGQHQLDPARELLPLDERIAEQDDPIAGAQRERVGGPRGGSCGGERQQGDEDGENGAQQGGS